MLTNTLNINSVINESFELIYSFVDYYEFIYYIYEFYLLM